MSYLLTQEDPSPEKPVLHRHVNDPIVLVQVAELWHLFGSKHSFKSKGKRKEIMIAINNQLHLIVLQFLQVLLVAYRSQGSN